MCRLLAVTAFLAGCSFPHGAGGPDDARVGDSPVTDVPIVIDTIMTDGPVDTPTTTTDTDGDGVPNATDNCPLAANANQRDHDSDAHGDVCDHCPHLASTADPDGDSDGVGDACDPHPSTAGDSIALFEGFYDATSINGWADSGNGTWSVANGKLTESSSGNNLSTIGPALSITRAAVTAAVHINTLGQTTFTTSPQVSVAGSWNSGDYDSCALTDIGGLGKRLYVSSNWTQYRFDSTGWGGTFANGSDLRITDAKIGTNNNC
ncbi:MAG TPA: thrombospondin type 3 repeat-containing protein, partial [Kofleriaceae bacterium]